ncbi:MAG: FAD-dependent oxidoreductase [Candidatus Coatesbacteria bacterium]|nr:FAD-dependent oxidoreductase [Candidatus Coatesbacteria bacterium]
MSRDSKNRQIGSANFEIAPSGGRLSYKLVTSERPPCNAACPAGVNAKAYIALTAEGRFDEALRVVRERLPIPGVMGRICSHPCETECARGEFDDPISICSLKRFIADYELRRGGRIIERISPTRPERVAIIGAGPAGLTAAQDLLMKGFGTTIFDRFNEPGGMLLAGIPPFRLPREILSLEIEHVLQMGIEIKTGISIGRDLGLNELLEQGFSAVLIAAGAHKGMSLGVEGEDLEGVLDAISFLASVHLDGNRTLGKRVIVIGGGDSAIDSARTALRLGASEVKIAYRRSRAEMPARDYEIEEALREGILIDYLVAPERILGTDGGVSSIELKKMRLGEPDSSGRRRPVPIDGSEFTVDCDSVVAALGQRPDLGLVEGIDGLEVTRWDTIGADERTCATSIPRIFAAGDIVSGAATAVEAIGMAHRAAEAIAAFIETGKASILEPRKYQTPVKYELIFSPTDERKRIKPPLADNLDVRSFDEVEMAYTLEQAREEASRCLMCGSCLECERCINECDGRYIALESEQREASWCDAELVKVQHAQLEDLLGEKREMARCSVKVGDADESALSGILAPIIALCDESLCIGCSTCEDACSYAAAKTTFVKDGRVVQVIDTAVCKGCGACIARCPTGALDQMHFSNERLAQSILDVKDKTVVFRCIWAKANHPDASDALANRLGDEAVFIDLLCTGRIPAWSIIGALENGAREVLIYSCGEDDCRYDSCHDVEETVAKLNAILYILGVTSDKIKLMTFDNTPHSNGD